MNTKKSDIAGYYPILISLQKFPCLVIGGGKVAYRKVSSLLEFNADVTVVSARVCRPLSELFKQGKIHIIKKSYSKEFIKDYKIIFSATDNHDVNKIIRKDCSEEGIILNAADNPSLCDFILPANIKRGDLTVSVSSQGKAPFYTKEIKKKLDRFISPVYSDIVYLAGEFRKHLLSGGQVKNTKDKSRMFKKFTSQNWEKILSENGKRSPRYYIQKILSDLTVRRPRSVAETIRATRKEFN